MNYVDYLGLPKLLDCQKLESEKVGRPAHDEMLFIIVHQVYELWFKQMLHELESVRRILADEQVDESKLGLAADRLHRVVEIQKHIVNQLAILETMTPLDFLEFRDLLVPASGFQSLQFRKIETLLGLRSSDRVSFGGKMLEKEAAKPLEEKASESSSLFELVDRWLSRTPFLKFQSFDFVAAYRVSVDAMLKRDREIILKNETLTEEGRARQLIALEETAKSFEAFWDPKAYQSLRDQGKRRLSFEASMASLLIFLYRDRPILQTPYRFLSCLIDMDEWWTTWRYRHVLMVHRMIGRKIGTGGSSGHDYLKKSAESHKVFSDFFDLSTFLVPRSQRPELPRDVESALDYVYSVSAKQGGAQ